MSHTEAVIADKTYEIANLEPGGIVGLPDGSDVEVVADIGGHDAGSYIRTLADGRTVVAQFIGEAEREHVAAALARASVRAVAVSAP